MLAESDFGISDFRESQCWGKLTHYDWACQVWQAAAGDGMQAHR